MQDAIAHLHVNRLALPVIKDAAWSNSDDLALLWLLLRRVGQDDAAGGLLIARDWLDDDAVAEGSECCLLGHW